MGKTLRKIAEELKVTDKKVQLIYAFNGTGKTRLSREFKELISPKGVEVEEEESKLKMLYYNAFTEDLFYWDNDLDTDVNRKFVIRPNGFTNLALNFLKEQGQDFNIISHFQRYTNLSTTPKFAEDFSEVTFSILSGGDDSIENIKISRGEESNFIWCVFYSLIEQIIEILDTPEDEIKSTNQFDDLEYVFIDDPVSSLDDTHLIELAVNIAELIKSSKSDVKFIITTHNPLFYNVLFNEFNNKYSKKSDYTDPRYNYKGKKDCIHKRLEKLNDGTFVIETQSSDSPFSYHLFLLSELEKAVISDNIQKFHFNFLRNILEKTSTFLGYEKWKDLLPEETEGSREAYYNRIINLCSHSKFSGEEVAMINSNDKNVLSYLVREIKEIYHFKQM